MAVDFKLEDHSVQVTNALHDAVVQFLIEASSELESQVADNSRVRTGQLKGSWTTHVDEPAQEATIGSPLENAIWEEFGTGEYAAEGNGRKGGWRYVDAEGKGHFTYGKQPHHALQRAFDSKKAIIKKRAEDVLKVKMGE